MGFLTSCRWTGQYPQLICKLAADGQLSENQFKSSDLFVFAICSYPVKVVGGSLGKISKSNKSEHLNKVLHYIFKAKRSKFQSSTSNILLAQKPQKRKFQKMIMGQ